MTKGAILSFILGVIGLVLGIIAMTPYNNYAPYSYLIGGGLPIALLLCGLGIIFIILGVWLARRSK